ncbi:MAG: hypothetical protein ABJN34_13090 [Litoreibacter sp.]|uniref:hypothetical protein n=1 Tax=Litoreibacter sp. TaxID=1969459 RepID=UPI003297871B
MFAKLKMYAIIAVLGFAAFSFFGSSSEQTADLGQVLDRTEYAIGSYQGYLEENKVTEATDTQIEEFRQFYAQILNSDPKFYDETMGLDIQSDGKFLGFADANSNGAQDSGEGELFTVEIDEENNRLIATDVAGNSSGLRFSGAGFIAGALIGNMLGRQRSAGISKSSFSNRNVSPRSNYKAPSSSRSGGLRAGK